MSFEDSEYEETIIISRLIVVLQAIGIPLYLFLFFWLFVEVKLDWIDHFWSEMLVHVLTPSLLSLPFIGWTYVRREQIAEAYERMFGRVWRLPVAIKAFYGFNFLLTIAFILPLVAPIVALFGGYFLGLLLFGRGSKDEEEGPTLRERALRKPVKILSILYLPLPAIIIFWVYSEALPEVLELIDEVWFQNLEFLFSSSLCLADAVTLGNALLLVYEGAREVDHLIEVPEKRIFLLTIAAFIILEGILIAFSEILIFIHFFAVLLGIGTLALRYAKGLTGEGGGQSIGGWLSIIAFQLINYVSEIFDVGRTMAIAFASVLFLILFLLSYHEAGKRFG
ncbi:MAG: hypothetical protein ACXACI_12745 [Candidatus Hodarchaeales archaeon]|jgi:hypothetical protein